MIIGAKRVQHSADKDPAERDMPEKANEASLHDDAREQGWQDLLRECHAAMKESTAAEAESKDASRHMK